jgi:uncharacterized membrane protein YfcA
MVDWIVGVFAALCAVVGLFLSAGALDDAMYVFGLGLFTFGCLFSFFLVKKAHDAAEAARPAPAAAE